MGSNSRTGFELAEGGEENYSLLEKKSVAITVIWPISGCDAALEKVVLQYHSLRHPRRDELESKFHSVSSLWVGLWTAPACAYLGGR